MTDFIPMGEEDCILSGEEHPINLQELRDRYDDQSEYGECCGCCVYSWAYVNNKDQVIYIECKHGPPMGGPTKDGPFTVHYACYPRVLPKNFCYQFKRGNFRKQVAEGG